ncbi:MAG: CPBP family intramembrane metalloprotease [Propionibacteriaceae bacterium]|nr:CPBP family intramembrane metalloprotease [Propionibacteriaceae bacterium]
MTLFGLIGEPTPIQRTTDLLTEDHPHRPYPAEHRILYSAILRGLIFIGLLLVSVVVFHGLWSAVQGSFWVSDVEFYLLEILGTVVAYLVLVLLIESRRPPLELAPRRVLGLIKGFLLGAMLIGCSVGILAIIGGYRITGFNPGYNPWMDLLTVGLVAGISEEILLRGILFRLVEEGLGSWGAVLISGGVFGFLHLSNPDGSVWGALAIALEAGILFAAIYVITRSLWWCIGVHMGWNIFQGPVFGSIVSGTGEQNSWLIPAFSGPDILTGGIFGMEASIIPVILLGSLGIGLLIFAQRKGLMILPIWTRKSRLRGSTISEQA